MTYAVADKRQAKPRRSRALRSYEPWLYLSPAIVLLVTVLLVPLIIGISYSFRKFSAFKSEFVGLAQYRAMLTDAVLGQALVNTLWWTVGSLFFQFFLGLGLALLLDKPFVGRKLVQAVVFLPWAVPSFLSGLTWAWLFNPIIGPLPHWLYALGLQGRADQHPVRSVHRHVGADHRQCLVRHSVLRHHAAGGAEVDPVGTA